MQRDDLGIPDILTFDIPFAIHCLSQSPEVLNRQPHLLLEPGLTLCSSKGKKVTEVNHNYISQECTVVHPLLHSVKKNMVLKY